MPCHVMVEMVLKLYASEMIASWLTYLSLTHSCRASAPNKPLTNELHDARGHRFHFEQVPLRSMQRPQSYFVTKKNADGRTDGQTDRQTD